MTGSPSPRLTVAFRTDASLEIGTGHVMRCLTLADALRQRGADCLFLCRAHSGHLMGQITARGHRIHALSAAEGAPTPTREDPPHMSWLGVDWSVDAGETRQALDGAVLDWLVVDHYAIDARWQRALRPACCRLMVIDDLADRAHDCDLLLDPSLGRMRTDYEGKISNSTVSLLGPLYALLRPEFAALRAESLARRTSGELRHLLITMGGVDRDNATGRVLDALDACALPSDLRITVVMGPHAPYLPEVRTRASRMRTETTVRVGVRDMARLMTDSDLAIGAAGGTSWERCCMGLPAFIMCLADNQLEMAATLQDSGAVIATKDPGEIARFLVEHWESGSMKAFLTSASSAAASITDGIGAERTCGAMLV